MSEEKKELRQCVKCRCTILQSYFSLNRKGEYYKTCDNCRRKRRKKRGEEASLKRFQCSKCSYKAGENSTLQKHIKTVHLGERNFGCSECESKFGSNTTLQRHIRNVHRGEQKFKCPECDSKFGANNNLQRHISTVHLNERNFPCPDCEYKAGTNTHLQTHIKRCTGEMHCSAGEYAIMQTLGSMKVEYKYDKSHVLKSAEDNFLRWDFIIQTDGDPLFIEYDGKQHFQSFKYFGGEDKLKKTQAHDKLKNDYCGDNGFLLLRIPYTEFENVNKLVVGFIRDNTNWGYE